MPTSETPEARSARFKAFLVARAERASSKSAEKKAARAARTDKKTMPYFKAAKTTKRCSHIHKSVVEAMECTELGEHPGVIVHIGPPESGTDRLAYKAEPGDEIVLEGRG